MEWLTLLRPGMTVLDIGANVGSYARQMKERVMPGGQVVCIEPQAVFAPTLATYGPVLSLAVGDHEGQVLFCESQAKDQSSLWVENVPALAQQYPVRLASLDGLQASGELPPVVDFMKIDIQGSETAFVRGASQLLREQHPGLYIEVWANGLAAAGSSSDELCDLLADLGYAAEMEWAAIKASARAQQGHSSIDVTLWQRGAQ